MYNMMANFGTEVYGKV